MLVWAIASLILHFGVTTNNIRALYNFNILAVNRDLLLNTFIINLLSWNIQSDDFMLFKIRTKQILEITAKEVNIF